MAEPLDETNPERPGPKPKYLPRIIYKPPEADIDPEALEEEASAVKPVEPKRAPKPKTSKPKLQPAQPDGVLLEETPELDTFDSRRRVRMAIGGVAVGVLLISLFSLYRALQPVPLDEESSPDDSAAVASSPRKPVAESPAARERTAVQLLADARQYEKAGKMELALERVQRVLESYGDVPSAKVATEARKRHDLGLPLFVDVAAVIATRTETVEPSPDEAKEAVDPDAVVVEVTPVTPAPIGPANVEVLPPSPTQPMTPNAAAPVVLAEPRRMTGVGLPAADVPARALPVGFTPRPEVGVHESGWPLEITCDRDGGSMIFIPGGIFIQGRDDGRPEERPAHRVSLSPYYIDQHEVTANQFAYFQGRAQVAGAGDRPAVEVSLAQARDYASWAGKSLPTEAQWEMAARATDARVYPWGNSAPSWERPRSPKQIDPVMSYPGDLSPYGVFDLSGNAWEWTGDWFDVRAYAPFKDQVAMNPAGPSQPKGKIPEVVIKGGSRNWDASWRSGMRPDATLDYLGFRCVLNLEGQPQTMPNNAAPGVGRFDGVPF